MKRKLIEMHQEYSIVCDNKECDFKVKSQTGDPNEDVSEYLNVACPKCGENLLTEQDYLTSLKVLKMVNWANRWFGWMAYLTPKNKKAKIVSVHCHEGINIREKTSS